MLYTAILFLPTMVCMLYLNLYVRRTRKTSVQWMMLAMLIVVAVYTASDVLYMESEGNYALKTLADIICMACVPLLPLLSALTLCRMGNIDFKKWHVDFLLVLPVILIFSMGALLIITGWDNVVAFEQAISADGELSHFLWPSLSDMPEGFREPAYLWINRLTVSGYYSLVALEMVALTVFVFYRLWKHHEKPFQTFRFFFCGGESSPFYLTSVSYFWFGVFTTFRIAFGYSYLSDHHWLGIVYSFGIAITAYGIFYLGLLAHIPHFTLAGATRPLLFEQNQGESDSMQTGIKSCVVTPSGDDCCDNNEGKPSATYHELTIALDRLMQNEQLFLNPNITIEDVASELCSNRVYVSRAVNMVKGLTFREYINQLRIEYAQQYMTAHPEVTQEIVATCSGYVDASAFNKKFRQLVGCTPREWLDRGGQRKPQD